MAASGRSCLAMTDREKFYQVINSFDFLQPYWDQKKHKVKIDEIEERLGTMSTGEKHLALFMIGVWFHRSQIGMEFDLFTAFSTLGGHFRKPVIDWVNNPYYP